VMIEGLSKLLDDGTSLPDFYDQVMTQTGYIAMLENKPTEENKLTILNEIKSLIGDYVTYELAFIRCPLDKRSIANHTYTTIINNFPAISKSFTYDDVSVDITDLLVTVKLKLTPTSFDYATGFNRENMVADKLKESFFADFKVVFDKKDDEISVENSI